jgi:hypothetical protein
MARSSTGWNKSATNNTEGNDGYWTSHKPKTERCSRGLSFSKVVKLRPTVTGRNQNIPSLVRMELPVLRQTMRNRLQVKPNEVNAALQRGIHEPMPAPGKWPRCGGGRLCYCGAPMNQPAPARFGFRVGWLWQRSLSRRTQTGRVLWDRGRRARVRRCGVFARRSDVGRPIPTSNCVLPWQ